ncbi:Fic family protein [Salinarimonas ramus]|uniref:Fido domain-containing protein n=1 Tax=Salinarimonas ramus TaxID=690164 RepID=A0A917V8N3_9HYPH|nr:Fic family protein [Salinarimonas ramus]GGK49969.1 hypothetical protein GCM10011322_41280 [Salinarimonas ramus]
MSSRHSEADEPSLVTDPRLIGQIESENALAQYDEAMSLLERKLATGERRIRQYEILSLHRTLMDRISASAGNFRPAGVKIRGSAHEPPRADEVPRHVEELCDYVNENWERRTSLHLASYALWRINWIHPFADGNGRTARIVSYLILCLHSGTRLPGTLTIPEQISRNKAPYYAALEHADARSVAGDVDVSHLEDLVSKCLATQLLDFYQKVSGQPVGANLDAQTRHELDRVLATVEKPASFAAGPAEPIVVDEASRRGIIGWFEKHPAITAGLAALLAALILGTFTLLAG